MRLAVVLTDLKGWKCITENYLQYPDTALKDLIQFIGSRESGLYNHVRKYILNLDVPFSLQKNCAAPADDLFLITASALTLSLRPIHISKFNNFDHLNESYATQQYCVFILTIPWLVQRIPAALLPALQHNSVISPCFKTLLVRFCILCLTVFPQTLIYGPQNLCICLVLKASTLRSPKVLICTVKVALLRNSIWYGKFKSRGNTCQF